MANECGRGIERGSGIVGSGCRLVVGCEVVDEGNTVDEGCEAAEGNLDVEDGVEQVEDWTFALSYERGDGIERPRH